MRIKTKDKLFEDDLGCLMKQLRAGSIDKKRTIWYNVFMLNPETREWHESAPMTYAADRDSEIKFYVETGRILNDLSQREPDNPLPHRQKQIIQGFAEQRLIEIKHLSRRDW